MFYKVELKDHIRVPPSLFSLPLEEAVLKRIKTKYNGFISKDLGIVIEVAGMKEVGEGMIIAGDGASYYDVSFELLTFKPELQEIVNGKIRDIAEFGAFINIGPIDGMIHISELQWKRTEQVEDVLTMGQEVEAKVIEYDAAEGKTRLSLRQMTEPPEGMPPPRPFSGPPRGGRPGGGFGGRGPRR